LFRELNLLNNQLQNWSFAWVKVQVADELQKTKHLRTKKFK